MMFKGVTKVNWDDAGEAIPSFLLLICMPLTYNIGYGLFAGWAAWVVINGLSFCVELLKDPHGSIERKKAEVYTYLDNGKAGLPCYAFRKAPAEATEAGGRTDNDDVSVKTSPA